MAQLMPESTYAIVGKEGLYIIEIEPTYHDYEISVIDHFLKGRWIRRVLDIGKGIVIIAFEDKSSLFIFDWKNNSIIDEIQNQFEVDGKCNYRSIKPLTEMMFYAVRTDNAIYLLDLKTKNKVERFTELIKLPESEWSGHSDTLWLDLTKSDKILITTTQTIKVSDMVREHKVIEYCLTM